MANADKAGTNYNLMMQIGMAQFSGADNYNWILNHDVPGELTANWYWDGVWKTVGTWATYLARTNDTGFVTQSASPAVPCTSNCRSSAASRWPAATTRSPAP